MIRTTTRVAAWAAWFATSSCALAQFDLNINLTGEVTDAQAAAVAEAEALWESLITGYATLDGDGPFGIAGPTVNITIEPNDGPGGVLGFAGPTGLGFDSGTIFSTAGNVTLDSEDADALIANGLFDDVLVHEIGHVLGIGILWVVNGLYETGSGTYFGEEALAAFRTEFDPTAEFVPIELDGGPGTANAHINENLAFPGEPTPETDPGDVFPTLTVIDPLSPNFGASLNAEILTGRLSFGAFVSDTTLGFLRDLGFTTVTIAVPEPGGATLAIAAGGMLGGGGRRRRSPVERG